MTEIIEAIDDFTADRYSSYSTKLYGFCELMRKTAGDGGAEQIFPVTIPASPPADRVHVALKDVFNLITWIRWAAPVTYEPSEEWSFGKNEARLGTLPLRIVFAHKTILGEDLVFDFINAFPSKFTIPGFDLVHVQGTPTIDPDHETVYTTEFSNTAYEKHRFTWNLYAVNVTIQFLECEELTP